MDDVTGIIFDVREFCLHDGPGVRTTVFLKGCPLRCLWCHNPEGQSMAPERLVVDSAACMNCGRCRDVCPSPDSCIGCGRCAVACPARRRRLCGERTTAADLAKRILLDAEVLAASGGGVTFSGGEPLAQIDFVADLTSRLAPIHIAVETCGHAPEADYLRMLSFTSLVLQDWKCFGESLHRRLAGVSNNLIQHNIRLLAESGRPFFLRLPLVPGLNDSDAELEAAARFFISLKAKALQGIQLLPYHPVGETKLRQLGRTSEMPPLEGNAPNPNAQAIFQNAGLDCSYPFGM